MTRKIKVATMGLAAALSLSASSSWANCGSCGTGGCGTGNEKAGCTGGVCPVSHADEKAGAKAEVISTEALAGLISSKAAVTILDARSGKYDDGRRIPGAQQLTPTADAADIAKVLPDKNATIVTYCAGVKCPASKMLADRLKGLGYAKVIEYPQGIAGWAEAGKSIEQKGK